MGFTFKPLYSGNNQSISFSDLNSLATGSSVFSGDIDNSSNLYGDFLVAGAFTAGSSGVSGTGTLLVIVAASVDGGSTYPSNVSDCKVIGVLNCASNGATPKLDPTSIAALYGGRTPQHFKVGVVNNSGVALASSGNSMSYQAVNDQSTP